MSKMNTIDLDIKQSCEYKDGEDYNLDEKEYNELRQEINEYLHDRLPADALSFKALGILEDNGVDITK